MVSNEKAKLDVKFDNVVDIDGGKENLCIKARVLRLWKTVAFLNPSESSSLDMVLVDEKGGEIHATVRKQLIYICLIPSLKRIRLNAYWEYLDWRFWMQG
ncbi:hypothetical protein TSUD_90760 [Trifolium subterraneum]|uniref:Replication protein A 70 kDa DNA-binding subunit B/D first OB fold domain-containing protein n=1 Tax=Trifolium subterraneum TaxID=3900 RepID=A0A2Z6P0T2_TRISU|nr:hypothetical protein TSUD_90760 [Trifolium subterraneum]